MLDFRGWLKEKRPRHDAKQGQLKRKKVTRNSVLLLQPARGEQSRMGLKAGKPQERAVETLGQAASHLQPRGKMGA